MLAEYGLDPISIDRRWTDELFLLMLEKLAERKRRQADAMNPDKPKMVSDKQLFSAMGMQPRIHRVK